MAQVAAVPLKAGPNQETTMRVQEEVDGDLITRGDAPDGEGHRVDVAEHLGRGHVTCRFAERLCRLRTQQPPSSDLETFDPGRRH